MSRVPANFVFPKMSLMTLITSWFCGNESMKTVPLKLLTATEIKNTKERYKLSQMKTLMLAVEIAAERVGTWDAFVWRGAWDVGSTVRLLRVFIIILGIRHRSNIGMLILAGRLCKTFSNRTAKCLQLI